MIGFSEGFHDAAVAVVNTERLVMRHIQKDTQERNMISI